MDKMTRHLSGDEALSAGWLAPKPDCRNCGKFYVRKITSKDGRPDYVCHIPECPDCFEQRIKDDKDPNSARRRFEESAQKLREKMFTSPLAKLADLEKVHEAALKEIAELKHRLEVTTGIAQDFQTVARDRETTISVLQEEREFLLQRLEERDIADESK